MLSLAVGLAAAATSVSLIDSVGLRPLAVADPGSLVRISLGVGKEHPDRAAAADATAIRLNAHALSGVAVDEMRGAGLSGPEGPPIIPMVEVVSGNFFALLGVPPARGRVITSTDDEPGAAPVVMLSDRFWQRRYGADPTVLGRAIDLNGVAVEVTGIVPAAFNGLNPIVAPDLWVPLNTLRQITRATERAWAASLANERDFNIVGRLATGATLDALRPQLDSAAAEMAAERPDIRHDTTLVAEFDRDVRRRPALMLASLAGTTAPRHGDARRAWRHARETRAATHRREPRAGRRGGLPWPLRQLVAHPRGTGALAEHRRAPRL
jgi:hypothetical protein